jgi:hypothetical protein
VVLNMGSNATSLAILDAENRVVTFVRLDVPIAWSPPEGHTAVPNDELPEGWVRAPEPQPPVPESISPEQLRLWLIDHGILGSTVDAAIASIQDAVARERVRVQWEYGLEVVRSSAWLAALAPVLGLDDAALDQAFREAATL